MFSCVQKSFSCVLFAGFFYKLVYWCTWLGYVIWFMLLSLCCLSCNTSQCGTFLGHSIEVNVAATVSLFCIIIVNWWISSVAACKLHIPNLPKQQSSRYADNDSRSVLLHACMSICHECQDMPFCSNCPKFGQLICRKIFRDVATRCQILRLEGTKFDFGWGSAPDPAAWGAHNSPQDPLAAFKKLYF